MRRAVVGFFVATSLCLCAADEQPTPVPGVRWTAPSSSVWDQARKTDRLVFLHVSSDTAPLGRAMEEQSFANAEVAQALATSCLAVRVDAAEDPLTAQRARTLAHQLASTDDLPVNLWLSPEGLPVEAAGYLPPSSEWGRDGFTTVLKRVSDNWIHSRGTAEARAEEGVASLPSPAEPPRPEELRATLAAGEARILAAMDPATGTVGEPPHFIDPWLWLHLVRKSPETRARVVALLRNLRQSPMRDPRGGYHRRAAEAGWASPGGDLLLADQVAMATLCLELADQPPGTEWLEEASAILGFVDRELTGPGGALIEGIRRDESGRESPMPRRIVGLNAQAAWVFAHASAATRRPEWKKATLRILAALDRSTNLDTPVAVLGSGQPASAADIAWLIAAKAVAGQEIQAVTHALHTRWNAGIGQWDDRPQEDPSWWSLNVPLLHRPAGTLDAPAVILYTASVQTPADVARARTLFDSDAPSIQDPDGVRLLLGTPKD